MLELGLCLSVWLLARLVVFRYQRISRLPRAPAAALSTWTPEATGQPCDTRDTAAAAAVWEYFVSVLGRRRLWYMRVDTSWLQIWSRPFTLGVTH